MTLSYQRYRFAGTQRYDKSNIYQYQYLSATTLHGPAICLLGFTGCSSLDAGAGTGFHTALIGKRDPHPNEDADEDVVAANRDWYQMR
jgi:protein-L-isoaspartate O-methyltransferase